jgi:tryptophanyl-tRNA synthetase
MDLQEPTAKMSKSAASPGTIALLEDRKTTTKRIKSAVTDSDAQIRFDPETKPGVSNLLQILAASTGDDVEAVAARFSGQGYGDLKGAVADAVGDFLAPIQARYAELEQDPGYVAEALALGAAKAEAIAAKVVERARRAAGLLPRT